MAGKSKESADQFVDIEHCLHLKTKEVQNDNVYFNVVIFGAKGVGKKTLCYFKPVLKKNGLQMNVTIKAELQHSIMIRADVPDNRPIEYYSTKEDCVKIQLTFIDVEHEHQVVNDEGHMHIYLFDLTQKSSMEALEKLSVENSSVHSILIGNKVDLVEERAVGQEDIDNLYKKLKCSQKGVISALTGEGVMQQVWFILMRVRSVWIHKRMAVLIEEAKEKEERERKEKEAKREADTIARYPHFKDPENCDETCNCIERLKYETEVVFDDSSDENSDEQDVSSDEKDENNHEQDVGRDESSDEPLI